MLPASIAPDIRRQVLHYLGATFNFRDRAVEQALQRFLNDPEEGIFKGPWIQFRRPFRPAGPEELVAFLLKPPFHPFKHQYRSWKRLFSGGDHAPQSTLVTTGTGSGKTECFLFPILDTCLRQRQMGRQGIKAIVLYPMNALANDQAGRFAKQVLDVPAYKDAGIRVGLYTGYDDNAAAGGRHSSMGYLDGKKDTAYAIDDHEAMKANPPDTRVRQSMAGTIPAWNLSRVIPNHTKHHRIAHLTRHPALRHNPAGEFLALLDLMVGPVIGEFIAGCRPGMTNRGNQRIPSRNARLSPSDTANTTGSTMQNRITLILT